MERKTIDWLSKIIEKFIDTYFEQKAVQKYLSGIKNLVRANDNEGMKRSEDFSFNLFILFFLWSFSEAFAIIKIIFHNFYTLACLISSALYSWAELQTCWNSKKYNFWFDKAKYPLTCNFYIFAFLSLMPCWAFNVETIELEWSSFMCSIILKDALNSHSGTLLSFI